MSDLKLFHIENRTAVELQGATLALERPLQALVERNMAGLLGVRFVASEEDGSADRRSPPRIRPPQ
jgi:hypothetical protein